ncbi:hypothetical protein B0H16DRAFT_1891361 [Mycena metata]|uniref:F-box domain-containing protein n=1 Tax=Mycena metata TaxID=1033252 RepID=A0AAD7MZ17_9AGAR|nr:hypothetical protein B0H16DRAFT_1891361 [Mycena metata]
MSTKVELDKRIEVLSLAIELQHQVLRDLETKRSLARMDLNTICDPMARLPLEISSEIFLRCLPDSPGPGCDDSPTVLLLVCRLWHEIASSTPLLWTTLHNGPAHATNFKRLHVAEINRSSMAWIRRAQNRPITVAIHGPLQLSPSLEQHAHRIDQLKLCLPSRLELQRLTFPFPSLTKLKIEIVEPHSTVGVTVECLELLRAAPCVVDCEFAGPNSLWTVTDENVPPTPLTHLRLQHLRLGLYYGFDSFSQTIIPHCPHILRYLTLPALRSLFISDFEDLGSHEVEEFLARSSPPLRSLNIVTRDDDLSESRGYFRLLPHLTDLTVDFMNDLENLDFLEDNHHTSLPNLRTLTIRGGVHVIVGALTGARRGSKLRSFRHIFFEPPELTDNTLMALRQLVRDGMEIYIGTRNMNMI